MLTPHDIEEYPLPKVLGGYKCEAVDELLDTIAADLQKLYDENLEKTKKMNVLVEKITEYRQDEADLKKAMIQAQRLVADSTAEATAKAEEIINEANAKAEEIIQNAIQAAQAADEHYESMRVEVNSFRNQLLTTYKSHIEIISALPVYEREEQEVVEEEETVQAEEVVETPVAEEVAEELDVPAAVEAEPEAPVADMSDLAAAISDMDPVDEDAETDYDTVNFDA